jgi:hypothetical protein
MEMGRRIRSWSAACAPIPSRLSLGRCHAVDIVRATGIIVALALTLLASSARAQPNQPEQHAPVEEPLPQPPPADAAPPPPPQAQRTPPGYPAPKPRYHSVPYERGMAIPPGGQVVSKSDWKLVGYGAAVFGLSYSAPLIAGSIILAASDDPEKRKSARRVMIPVVGPFFVISKVSRRDAALLVLGGFWQGAGIIAAITGLFKRERTLVYYGKGRTGRRVALTPRLGVRSAGMSLTW